MIINGTDAATDLSSHFGLSSATKKKKEDISAGFFLLLFCMHVGSGATCMHVTRASYMSLLSQRIESKGRVFPVRLHVRVRRDWGVCMLPTGNCSHHGSVEGGREGGRWWLRGGGQPSRTINRKLKGCEGGGGVKKAFRTRGHLHNVHIDCYLQVQQSFKFPVEWKQNKQ